MALPPLPLLPLTLLQMTVPWEEAAASTEVFAVASIAAAVAEVVAALLAAAAFVEAAVVVAVSGGPSLGRVVAAGCRLRPLHFLLPPTRTVEEVPL